ncbi:MAG TPA: helix-turn-helix transcriptional regulator [Bacillus bacterium]|nr:helix-turn-helix transcriptional regulator [Bacillus sp. (in: firmicutes)]
MNKKRIGKKLLKLRGDIPREEVANAVKISISALQMYENGQRIPRDEIKMRLAEYYKATVQEIFFEHKTHDMSGKNVLNKPETA